MINNWVYYAVALALIVTVAYIFKKLTSCILKVVVFLVLLVFLGLAYHYVM